MDGALCGVQACGRRWPTTSAVARRSLIPPQWSGGGGAGRAATVPYVRPPPPRGYVWGRHVGPGWLGLMYRTGNGAMYGALNGRPGASLPPSSAVSFIKPSLPAWDATAGGRYLQTRRHPNACAVYLCWGVMRRGAAIDANWFLRTCHHQDPICRSAFGSACCASPAISPSTSYSALTSNPPPGLRPPPPAFCQPSASFSALTGRCHLVGCE
jgi:hypothetical protein